MLARRLLHGRQWWRHRSNGRRHGFPRCSSGCSTKWGTDTEQSSRRWIWRLCRWSFAANREMPKRLGASSSSSRVSVSPSSLRGTLSSPVSSSTGASSVASGGAILGSSVSPRSLLPESLLVPRWIQQQTRRWMRCCLPQPRPKERCRSPSPPGAGAPGFVCV